jgi:hypothetical protein
MKRIVQSAACGVFITGALLAAGLSSGSETIGCIFLWNACVLTALLKPGHESPTILLFVLSGVPIYSVVAYYVLGKLKSRRRNDGEQIVGRERRERVS